MTKIMIQAGSYRISKQIDPDNKGFYLLENRFTNEIVAGSNRMNDLITALTQLNNERLPEVQV